MCEAGPEQEAQPAMEVHSAVAAEEAQPAPARSSLDDPEGDGFPDEGMEDDAAPDEPAADAAPGGVLVEVAALNGAVVRKVSDSASVPTSPSERSIPPRNALDSAYDRLAAIPFPQERISELVDKDFLAWMGRLQGAVQLPWETVFFMLISQTSFQLYRTTAQYTKMLSIPPLPWLCIAGRPGQAKSIAVWFLKQITLELQKRSGPIDDSDEDGDEDASKDEDEAKGKRANPKKSMGKRFLVDMGTLYGFLSQASRNSQRAFAALHEGKTFLAKTLAEAPGFDPQALNKLYDRDEVSNAVMSVGSRFTMDQPWVVFFLALHLEEVRSLFGGAGADKDSCACFSRFDFFHRAGLVPDLADYNSYDADDAIEFTADVMQLVEAAFPKLTRDELKAYGKDASYSKRTGLWKVPQDNAFFRASFQRHSEAQRQAIRDGDDHAASHESKIKTKECRYSVPADALMKAFRQKMELERYRAEVIQQARADGEEAVADAVAEMSILALRQRVMDKDLGRARDMHLPLWPRAVTEQAAEVGHLLTHFLAESAVIIKGFVRGLPDGSRGPDAAMSPGSGSAALPAAPTPLANDAPQHMAAILEGDSLRVALAELPLDRVKAAVAEVLKQPAKVIKLKNLRLLPAGRLQQAALGLLHCVGLVLRVAWKRRGATGYASTFLVKNANFADQLAELKAANLLRIFQVSVSEFKMQAEDEQAREVLADNASLLPAITSEAVDLWVATWSSCFYVEAAPPTPAAPAPKTPAPAPRTPAPAPRQPLDAIAARRNSTHFKWICAQTSERNIKKSYVAKKIAGFNANGDDWDLLVATMGALGLARDVTRGASKGAFEFSRPADPAQIPIVVEGISKTFGPLDARGQAVLQTKLQASPINDGFEIETFHIVLKSLRDE